MAQYFGHNDAAIELLERHFERENVFRVSKFDHTIAALKTIGWALKKHVQFGSTLSGSVDMLQYLAHAPGVKKSEILPIQLRVIFDLLSDIFVNQFDIHFDKLLTAMSALTMSIQLDLESTKSIKMPCFEINTQCFEPIATAISDAQYYSLTPISGPSDRNHDLVFADAGDYVWLRRDRSQLIYKGSKGQHWARIAATYHQLQVVESDETLEQLDHVEQLLVGQVEKPTEIISAVLDDSNPLAALNLLWDHVFHHLMKLRETHPKTTELPPSPQHRVSTAIALGAQAFRGFSKGEGNILCSITQLIYCIRRKSTYQDPSFSPLPYLRGFRRFLG